QQKRRDNRQCGCKLGALQALEEERIQREQSVGQNRSQHDVGQKRPEDDDRDNCDYREEDQEENLFLPHNAYIRRRRAACSSVRRTQTSTIARRQEKSRSVLSRGRESSCLDLITQPAEFERLVKFPRAKCSTLIE